MIIAEKITSLREQMGVEYVRPPKEKLDKLQAELKLNEVAMNYLTKERGLIEDTIEHFRLGYDETRNAISIPIFKRGELVNIKYRFLEPKQIKYSSERNAESWIFNEDGINEGIKKEAVLIVEGEFDLMSIYQSGIRNVISSSSGKDGYAPWIELLDLVKKVYIALDNDTPGRETSLKMSGRIGVEKSLEVRYPEGIKDANEFFKTHTKEEFKDLIRNAVPFYRYQFKGMGDIINSIRTKKDGVVKTEFLPKVEMEKDWLVMLSGKTNSGKTSYILNIAEDLTNKKLPVLVFPFERGIETVGKRFLQVKLNKTMVDIGYMNDEEWDKTIEECIDLPIYFAMPKKDDIINTIVKAKRIFDIKVVIVDHLDYIIRHTNGNKENEISNTLQELKRVAEEHGIIMMVVTHVRKVEAPGSMLKKKATMEDLKGSSSLYQDPEVVAMLDGDESGKLEVTIVKNKGEMKSRVFDFNVGTGKIFINLMDDFDSL